MTNQHPITPPPELIEQWMQDHATRYDLARQAAQWGADQELEACLGEVSFYEGRALADRVRASRRPKPSNLKYQALKSLGHINRGIDRPEDTDIIRRALEALPE